MCEGKEFSIGFERIGNLEVSSFISIDIDAISAKPGIDFIQNTAEQIQFDPGLS